MSRLVPRSSPRHLVRLPAHCRTLDGRAGDGELFDISIEGCCVRVDRALFHVGARVVVAPLGMHGQPGIVRWSRSALAGVEFDQPVRAHLVEDLVARHGAEVVAEGR